MKLLAFNGSPRKKWNTATLLEHALKGAKSEGAKTELIHLYDLDYKGCTSCFACKRIGSKSYGHCAVKDDLLPVFKKVEAADAILVGSPIYYSITTGETRCFLERLMYQVLGLRQGAFNAFWPEDPDRVYLHGRGKGRDGKEDGL